MGTECHDNSYHILLYVVAVVNAADELQCASHIVNTSEGVTVSLPKAAVESDDFFVLVLFVYICIYCNLWPRMQCPPFCNFGNDRSTHGTLRATV